VVLIPALPGLVDGAPIAGRHYPKTYADFASWFSDDHACRAYLEWLRWPSGFVCPGCGALGEPYRASRNRLVCSSCRGETTVTTGTIFERTQKPLTMWFVTAWEIVSQKNGLSALALNDAIGVGTYEAAWTMLHKYRSVMVRPDRDRLSGDVEVDETYVGGGEEGVRGRETKTKSIVAIAVEVRRPRGFGRARLRRVPDVSGTSLVSFVCDVVEPGSVVLTDGWRGYHGIGSRGYTHGKTVLSSTNDPAHVAMPAVHRVASLLKRWLLGTHQGSVRPEHLQAYLEEFTFRFNRRTSRSRGLLFYRLLEQAVTANPLPWADIVGGPTEDPDHKM